MPSNEIIKMGEDDTANYLGVVNDRIEEGLLDKGVTVPAIRQMFTMYGQYIGAVIVIHSSEKSLSGEPLSRTWIFADADWNEIAYKNVSELYLHLKTLVKPNDSGKILFRYHEYVYNKQAFEFNSQYTMDLTAYGDNRLPGV